MFFHVAHHMYWQLMQTFRWPQNLRPKCWFSLIRYQCVGYHHRSPKWFWLPYSYANLQLKGMQEFTGDGCTHGQAWVAIFNRSTTCMDPHSHFPLPTPCSAYVSLGFPRTRPERDTGSTTYLTVVGSEPHSVANLHPVSPVKSHVQDFFSLRNEASFLNWKTWIIDQ